jgi:hypothetical protein
VEGDWPNLNKLRPASRNINFFQRKPLSTHKHYGIKRSRLAGCHWIPR